MDSYVWANNVDPDQNFNEAVCDWAHTGSHRFAIQYNLNLLLIIFRNNLDIY